jgi:hypothetical protein
MAVDELSIVLIGVGGPRQGELPEVAQTNRPLAALPREAYCRNEDRQQDRNYGNYDQQLDESEAVGVDDWVRMPLRPTRIRLPTSCLALSATHRSCSHPPNDRPSESTGIHFLKGARIKAGPSISVSITTLYCATGAEFVNIIRRNIAFGARLRFVAEPPRLRDPQRKTSHLGAPVMLNEVKHLGHECSQRLLSRLAERSFAAAQSLP